MQKTILTAILILLASLNLHSSPPKKMDLVVLQFNIWHEGTIVKRGFEAVIDEIIRTKADLIALSEVRNYNGKALNERLIKALADKGFTYYSEHSEDSGILSKYPVISQTALYPVNDDRGSITKAIIDIKGTQVAFYSAHLDYLNCSLYLPRAYDGSTWEKLDAPVTDIAAIKEDNLLSKRDEAIDAFIKDAKQEKKRKRLVILGGDFNEPSHLDWTAKTKDMFDHNGVIIKWRNTLALEKAGFIDAYRKLYPNPVTHPGFTFPADNPLVDINKLAWSPLADDRDRIDFIFFYEDKRLKLKDASIVGPVGSIVRNKRRKEITEDKFDVTSSTWPSDHKAVKAKFLLKL
jgi:endonuclease/exonuclease/phosphatase family metal-dependent hydrolase